MTTAPMPSAGSSPNARPVHLFEVPLPASLNLDASLASLRRSGDDLFERWDGHTLLRVLTVDDHHVPVVMRPLRDRHALVIAVAQRPGKPVPDKALRRVISEQFITDEPAWQRLLANDPALARLDAEHPGIRPLRLTDPLYALVRSISAQQVNLRWAVTLRARLARRFATAHRIGEHTVHSIDTDRLATASVTELRELQFSTRKAAYLIEAATTAAAGQLNLAELRDLTDTEVVRRLTALHGVGRWTAEWFLARVLARPVVVAGDLVVRKTVGWTYGHIDTPTEDQTRQLTGHWGPAALVAQQLVLETAGSHASQSQRHTDR